MKGGRRSREKGNKVERAIVRALQEHGLGAERVPLSGSAGGSYVGDSTVPLLGVDRCVEVKARANGFRELYAWLDGRDLLVIKADRRVPLVVLPLDLAARIAMAAEAKKAGRHERRRHRSRIAWRPQRTRLSLPLPGSVARQGPRRPQPVAVNFGRR